MPLKETVDKTEYFRGILFNETESGLEKKAKYTYDKREKR